MSNLDKILQEVKDERTYQDGKWGHSLDDTKNTPALWMSYISNYMSLWMKGLFEPYPKSMMDDYRAKMIKTAALAIAAVESLDRQREENGKAFFEE